MNDAVVAVFARAPVLGEVKTRLAADVGDERALAIYQQMLGDTLRQVAGSGLDGVIAATDTASGALRDLAELNRCSVVPQNEGDLGQRMASVFSLLHQSYARVIIIGSDCPLMSAEHLNALAQQLEHSDVVMTPAEDGGYVSIGSRLSTLWHSKIFEGVQWSTAQTCSQTVSCLHALGVNVTMMNTLWDVDTFDDALRASQLGKLDLSLTQ